MIKTKISAEIIADSLSSGGTRLTSFILRFPRIVLAEFNTHRVLSRNSASSRAIPYPTMLDMVVSDPFIPIRFQKHHSGMQGDSYLEGDEEKLAIEYWLKARDAAVETSKNLTFLSDDVDLNRVLSMTKAEFDECAIVTKQNSNRLLEPFLWHTVIATGTNWENFFALRAHPAAEIHIDELAKRMLEVYNDHSPKQLKEGEWHIPFGDSIDEDRIFKLNEDTKEDTQEDTQDIKIKIATARCARVSYLNFEGKDDYFSDIKLYNNLLSMGHMSPFEHCARVASGYIPRSNFAGNWVQLRKMLPNESRLDDRVIKK